MKLILGAMLLAVAIAAPHNKESVPAHDEAAASLFQDTAYHIRGRLFGLGVPREALDEFYNGDLHLLPLDLKKLGRIMDWSAKWNIPKYLALRTNFKEEDLVEFKEVQNEIAHSVARYFKALSETADSFEKLLVNWDPKTRNSGPGMRQEMIDRSESLSEEQAGIFQDILVKIAKTTTSEHGWAEQVGHSMMNLPLEKNRA